MTTFYPASNYPTAIDSFMPRLIDNVDEVVANHQNTGYEAIENIQAKLGINTGVATGFGGVSFDAAGEAFNPGAIGDPNLWVNNAAPGFHIYYTDELGTDYDLITLALTPSIGVGFACLLGTAVGDLMYISAADTVLAADAVAGNSARGMVISVYGGGLVCDLLYVGEVVNAAWGLAAGSTYYLDLVGGFGLTPPVAPVVVQEIGFARNATTMIFRPTIEST